MLAAMVLVKINTAANMAAIPYCCLAVDGYAGDKAAIDIADAYAALLLLLAAAPECYGLAVRIRHHT